MSDDILGNLFIELDYYNEVYNYYLQFINKNSENYVLSVGDEKFSNFLKIHRIKSKSAKINQILTKENINEKFSTVLLLNTEPYIHKADLVEITEIIYSILEVGGTIITEIPDSLLFEKYQTTPEHFERVCKECNFKDIRIFKAPVNDKGLANYIVVAKKDK